MKRRGRPSALAALSVDDLMREVERRRGVLVELLDQRAQLENDMARLDAEINQLESLTGGGARRGRPGRPHGRGPGRPRGRRGAATGHRRGPGRPAGKIAGTRRGRGGNESSLVASLHSLLRGKTMGVAEMSDAVKKAGYKTSSPNFRTIVNAALITNPGKFKRVARGQYTSK
jgi:hypothetical protein